VEKIFAEDSGNFSSFTEENVKIKSVSENLTLTVDQNGVGGAVYERIPAGLGAIEGIFTVDRPFIYMITAADGSILYAGIYRG